MLPVHLFSSFASRCFIYYKGFISCHQWISAKLSVFFYKHYLLCTHRHNKFVTRMKPESLNLRLPLRVWAKLCTQTLLNRTRSLLIIDYFPIHWCSAVLQFQWLTSAFSFAPGADPTPNPERHSRPEQQTSRTGASAGFPAMQNKVSFKFTSEISFSVERDEGSGLIQSKPHFCLEHFTSTNERNTVKIHKTINGVHTGFGLDISPQLSTKSNIVPNMFKTLPGLYRKDFTPGIIQNNPYLKCHFQNMSHLLPSYNTETSNNYKWSKLCRLLTQL